MNQMQLTLLATLLSYCYLTAHAYYVGPGGGGGTEGAELADVDPHLREIIEDNEDLRKLLLKKLRFRSILKEHMKPPETMVEGADEETNTADIHKATKRHKMEDLMSRVQAYLDQYKERQIKESMSLPSLRFGRSGFNWKQFQ